MTVNMMKETKRNSLQVLRTLYSTVVPMILTQLLFLLVLQMKNTESSKNSMALPGCRESCGNISIPYPFGISQNCYFPNDDGNVTCKKPHGQNCFMEGFDLTCYIFDDGTSLLLLNKSRSMGGYFYEGYYDVWNIQNISLSLGQTRISSFPSVQCYNSTTKKDEPWVYEWEFVNIAPFWLNTENNKFIVTGCNTQAYLILADDNRPNFNYSVGCLSLCDSLDTLLQHGSCSGIGCCQTDIPKGTSTFMISFDQRLNNSEVYNFSVCSFAMVVEAAMFNFSTTYVTNEYYLISKTDLSMVLDWAIGNTTCEEAQTNKSSYACISDHSICLTVSGRGYLCNCSNGYEGNPYLDGGCQDIDECSKQNACPKPGK